MLHKDLVPEISHDLILICTLGISPGPGSPSQNMLRDISFLSFGRGASKSTTQGGIFDLNMYITFDCAGIAAF